MEQLKQLSKQKLDQTPGDFSRFLLDRINWSDRMIGISGARGCGKTTLILQQMEYRLSPDIKKLYISLDDIYFADHSLVSLAEQFYKTGGQYLFIDEVHKYPRWSRELKNIYDNWPELHVVFTSSSALNIYRGAYDLSRRAIVYSLPGMSYREFITFKYGKELPVLTLEQVLQEPQKWVSEILHQFRPLQYLEEYWRIGYYPFFIENEENYPARLLRILNQVLESDLPPIYNIDYNAILKIKKMLAVLSRIVPYKPNVEKLVRQTGITRDSLLKYLSYLEKADIVQWLTKDTFGINYLNKPDKLYLNNTNLMYALHPDTPDKGTLRETFILNQLSVNHKVSYPDKGDFLIDGKYLIEVGGPSKGSKQIADAENAFVTRDGIEYPVGNKIPLWLFGFLY